MVWLVFHPKSHVRSFHVCYLIKGTISPWKMSNPVSIISDDVHFAPTTVIALENTLNGTIIPQEEVIAISEYAHSQGMKMHLDGARIWHVAAETATPRLQSSVPPLTRSACVLARASVHTVHYIFKNRTDISYCQAHRWAHAWLARRLSSLRQSDSANSLEEVCARRVFS